MLNKRGHVPTFLLFVITLILVLTAWFTFLSFNEDIDAEGENIAKLISDLENDDYYIKSIFRENVNAAIGLANESDFETSFKSAFIKLNKEHDEVSEVSGNYFGKVRNGDFTLIKNEETYSLTLEEVFISSESNEGKDSIKRTFDLTVVFNETDVLEFS